MMDVAECEVCFLITFFFSPYTGTFFQIIINVFLIINSNANIFAELVILNSHIVLSKFELIIVTIFLLQNLYTLNIKSRHKPRY